MLPTPGRERRAGHQMAKKSKAFYCFQACAVFLHSEKYQTYSRNRHASQASSIQQLKTKQQRLKTKKPSHTCITQYKRKGFMSLCITREACDRPLWEMSAAVNSEASRSRNAAYGLAPTPQRHYQTEANQATKTNTKPSKEYNSPPPQRL